MTMTIDWGGGICPKSLLLASIVQVPEKSGLASWPIGAGETSAASTDAASKVFIMGGEIITRGWRLAEVAEGTEESLHGDTKTRRSTGDSDRIWCCSRRAKRGASNRCVPPPCLRVSVCDLSRASVPSVASAIHAAGAR